jgi:hypothetical protein
MIDYEFVDFDRAQKLIFDSHQIRIIFTHFRLLVIVLRSQNIMTISLFKWHFPNTVASAIKILPIFFNDMGNFYNWKFIYKYTIFFISIITFVRLLFVTFTKTLRLLNISADSINKLSANIDDDMHLSIMSIWINVSQYRWLCKQER